MSHVLIVAPDTDLRRSMQFALEADGYVVSGRASIADVNVTPEEIDCVILDHHMADRRLAVARIFCARFDPVVLLANTASHPLVVSVFRTLLKPQLGPTLSSAVSDALCAQSGSTASP
jgi:DNA-binding NtrC family response regulator